MVTSLYAFGARTLTMLNSSYPSAFGQPCVLLSIQRTNCRGATAFFSHCPHSSKVSKFFSKHQKLRSAGNCSHHSLECGFSLSEYSDGSPKLIWPSQNLLNLQNWAGHFMRTGSLTRLSVFPLLTRKYHEISLETRIICFD